MSIESTKPTVKFGRGGYLPKRKHKYPQMGHKVEIIAPYAWVAIIAAGFYIYVNVPF